MLINHELYYFLLMLSAKKKKQHCISTLKKELLKKGILTLKKH